MKSKGIVNSFNQVNFWYEELFIQGNTDSCYKHITCGVNVYLPLYGCVSLLTHTYALCCVCDVTSEY